VKEVNNFQVHNNGIYFLHVFRRKNDKDFTIHTLFGSVSIDSYQASSSLDFQILPKFIYTPFYDNFEEHLSNEISAEEKKKAVIYFAIRKEIIVPRSMEVFQGTSSLMEFIE